MQNVTAKLKINQAVQEKVACSNQKEIQAFRCGIHCEKGEKSQSRLKSACNGGNQVAKSDMSSC